MGTPPKVGLLYNPQSLHGAEWYNKQIHKLSAQKQPLAIGTQTPEEIPAALQKFAASSITHLAVIGGDGTLDATLTAMRNHSPFQTEPILALFNAGTTNMTFRDVGFKTRKHGPLRQFIAAAENNKLKLKQHRPLYIDSPSLTRPLYGFFLGTAAIPRAIHHTRQKYHQKGLTNSLSEGATILTSLFRLLRRKNVQQDALLAPVQNNIALDGKQKKGPAVLLMVTSLDKLLVGIKPYHGKQNQGFSVTGIFYPYGHVWQNIPTLLNGKNELPFTTNNNFIATQGQVCSLTFDGEWTLDGEMYHATSNAPLTVTQANPLTFAVGVA